MPERGEEAIDGVLRKCILRWHGHVERKGMSIVRTHMLGLYGGAAPAGGRRHGTTATIG